jgi:hypothetical protein
MNDASAGQPSATYGGESAMVAAPGTRLSLQQSSKARMKTTLYLALLTAVCVVPSGALAQRAHGDAVPVYDSTEIALDSYTVLKRLWVDSWKSALWIRGYRDEASAKRALLDEAAGIRADAVVNLYCLGQTDALFRPRGYYCYGNAIRFRKTMRKGNEQS